MLDALMSDWLRDAEVTARLRALTEAPEPRPVHDEPSEATVYEEAAVERVRALVAAVAP